MEDKRFPIWDIKSNLKYFLKNKSLYNVPVPSCEVSYSSHTTKIIMNNKNKNKRLFSIPIQETELNNLYLKMETYLFICIS